MNGMRNLTKDEFAEIITDYADENNEHAIYIDETDAFSLYNEKPLLYIESDSIMEVTPQVNYDKSFKVVLIDAPEDFNLEDTRKIMEVFPTEDTAFGIRESSSLKIVYLVNSKDDLQ